MTTETQTTQEVFDRHMQAVQALVSRGVEAMPELLADYASDAVVFTPDGVFEGEAGVRGFFEAMAPLMGDLFPKLEMKAQEIRAGTVYLVWSAGDAVPMGSETFVIRDGKIVAQTVALYMPG